MVVIYRDIRREHSLIGQRNCLMTEAANSLSAAAGPELSTTRYPITNLAPNSATAGLAWVRVCVLWRPGFLSTENAGRTMTVLRHALCRDDFHQTPVSIIFSGKCSKFFFWFSGRCNTGGITCVAVPKKIFLQAFKSTTGTTSTSQFFL